MHRTAAHHSATLLLGTRAAFGTRAAALAPTPAGLRPRPNGRVPGQVPATTLATADIKVGLIEYGHPGIDDRRLNQLFSAAMFFPRQAAPHHVIGASQQGRPRGGGRRVPRDDDHLVGRFGRLARAALFAPAHSSLPPTTTARTAPHRTHRALPCATARVSFRLLQVVRRATASSRTWACPRPTVRCPSLSARPPLGSSRTASSWTTRSWCPHARSRGVAA